MRKELLITVSALSLIASAGIGAAQDKGGNAGQGPGTQQAPAAQPGGGAAERGERMQPSQSQQPRQEDSRDNRAQSNQPANQGAQPRNQAQDRAQPDRNRQQQTQDRVNPQPKDATTGQGAAGRSGGAALTTEQRTKISTTIRQSNVRPATNVNFNISVGTVVPRSVTLHPLPAAVIEVYPDWRPYRFVLVGDEILVIDPATHRIVAVLDA